MTIWNSHRHRSGTAGLRRWSKLVLSRETRLSENESGTGTGTGQALHVLRRWSKRVLEEFFQQGDTERAHGLPLSPLMDRTTTALGPSQINFIEFVVAPLFLQANPC